MVESGLKWIFKILSHAVNSWLSCILKSSATKIPTGLWCPKIYDNFSWEMVWLTLRHPFLKTLEEQHCELEPWVTVNTSGMHRDSRLVSLSFPFHCYGVKRKVGSGQVSLVEWSFLCRASRYMSSSYILRSCSLMCEDYGRGERQGNLARLCCSNAWPTSGFGEAAGID